MSTDDERFGFSADDVWHATLDEGAYAAKVIRTDQYHGLLMVTEVATQKVLLETDVGLAFGAVFGPDQDDVFQWQQMTLEAVDGRDGT